jgi:hypothetical protein
MKFRTIGQDPGTRREVSVLSLAAVDLELTADQRARLDAAR